ncbi:Hpt domain-containing protein [Parvularcula sp. ZS-1/3]|uniref:Hpt domain-containing protein n=1 Tax=Parvularcula mediterranea TaxID=2732508 RepID=A0A7Y3RN45_9PROT|nr:Hpt domain-containing protein [Parvularcula mediterranea]NNU17147.1 Hpt domain-containing protein [Parvularcula mediterranea]
MGQIIDDEQITMLVQGAGVEAVIPILEAYWESNDELTAALEKGISAESPTDIAATAHGLKGSSANLGAMLVADRAKEIELAAKSGDLNMVRELFQKLPKDIAETRTAFDAIIESAAA